MAKYRKYVQFLTTSPTGFHASSKDSGSEFSRTFLNTFLQAGARTASSFSQLLPLTLSDLVPAVSSANFLFPLGLLFVLLGSLSRVCLRPAGPAGPPALLGKTFIGGAGSSW